jgi:hypothetical protein
VQHHETQHFETWMQYQNLPLEQQQSFFSKKTPLKQTLHAHFGHSQDVSLFTIHPNIVELFIGYVFFCSNDHGVVI